MTFKRILAVLPVLPVLALWAASASQAAQVTVAVAANFTAPMRVIAADFEHETGHQAKLSFGGTGSFYAQIRNGAPFDVLLAADTTTPSKLINDGLAIAGTTFTYATGRLVLWSEDPSLVDDQGQVLRSHRFNKLAIADPKLAPYGVAAQQVIEQLGLTQALAPKQVQGKNIAQTFQFVSSGNAQLGFVALSQVFERGQLKEGSAWVVPVDETIAIKQDAVLLMRGRDNAAAKALLSYLQTDRAKQVIQSFGYLL